MSVKVMAMVWEYEELKGSDLLVMLALADHARDDGLCWPSIPRIAERARLSTRQTQRVIKRLENEGYIRIVTKGDGRGNVTHYQIIEKGDKKSPKKEVIKGDKVTPKSAERVTSRAEKGDIAPHTREEPLTEPSTSIADDADALVRMVRETFVYVDTNGGNPTHARQLATKLVETHGWHSCAMALERAKERQGELSRSGKRGITAPLAYMRSILERDTNIGRDSPDLWQQLANQPIPDYMRGDHA